MARKLSLENIRKKNLSIERVDHKLISSGCTWDKNKYINYNTKVEFRCSCGKIHKKTPSKILRYKSKMMCPECRIINSRIKISQEIKDRFKKEGATVDFSTYTRRRIPLEFICKCGNPGKVSLDALIAYPKHHIHCKECARLYNLWINSGERHPRYNPNLTDEERKLNKGRRLMNPFITYWYREVKRRFKYTCVISGVKGDKVVTAHHLYNWASYPQYRIFRDNGVCISKEVHKKYHSTYGIKNNTYSQFFEFYHNETNKVFKGVDIGRN